MINTELQIAQKSDQKSYRNMQSSEFFPKETSFWATGELGELVTNE